MSRTIAILGAGVAGLAAAVEVANAGDRPIVIETRGKLGGRATSFEDSRTESVLDNCQHVVMGCCSNLLDFYEQLGVEGAIEWHDTTWWANPPGDPDEFRPSALPAPAHFTRAFLRMRMLDTADKRGVARAMWRMIRMGRDGRASWSGRDFAAFLHATRQTPRAIDRFWEPIVVGACNVPCNRCDASHAIKVFQEGFLQDAWSPCMGLSRVPLAELYAPAQGIVERAGGALRLGTSAIAINFDGARVTGVTTSAGVVDAAAVISSLPPDRLAKCASPTLRQADARLRRLDAIAFSPIVGVHLFFDAPVMTTPHLVLPGRATHWLFRKQGFGPYAQHVHAVISAADEWIELSECAIVRRVLDDVEWALPAARGLLPLQCRTVKERHATFASLPGVDRVRPTAQPNPLDGGVPNLFLAGDWTATGWPSTMEGAVRSGYAAAAFASGSAGVRGDVPPAPFARWLGLGA